MLVDTNAHINFNSFKDDSGDVIRRSLDNNVWLINVGSQYSTSKRAVEFAESYEKGVYAAIGLHPIHIQDEFEMERYRELAKSKKVVAVGEIGLDYKAEYVSFGKEQKAVLRQQLDLTEELGLPVIIHCRMAHKDLIEILSDYPLTGVIHCFTGTKEEAQKYIDKGFYLGFNGIIFKMNLEDIIKETPLEKILLETDCPYLTPPPMGGRNEPIYVKYVAEEIAKIKNFSYDEVINTTTKNAKKLFRI